MAQNLLSKVIFITGASSGIGRATAVACAEAGMRVMLAARRAERLKEVAERCREAGGPDAAAHWVTCDVNDDESMRRAFETSWETFGRLDAVFANAGYGLFKPALEAPLHEHEAIFNTNYFGTVRTLQAAEPSLRRTTDGLKHLLICSSCLSDLGLPGSGVYAATKAAQKSIATAMRAELAGRGMFVTSVHPVTTKTEFFEAAEGEEMPIDTHKRFAQSPNVIAKKVVRALRHRKPQVWGSIWVRWAMALLCASPSLSALAMRKLYEAETAAIDRSKQQRASKPEQERAQQSA